VVINENRWWERIHQNGKIAKVLKGSNADEYVASMSDPREGHVDTEPVARFDNESDAKAEADRLAHPDCDGSCMAWALMP
jgi:hypothetical protein